MGYAMRGSLMRRVVPALGRSGYAARSLLYTWLGALACRQALTGRGRPDFAGTFAAVHSAGGPVLLLVVAIGLWGYAVWRWTEALQNPEHRSMWSRQDIAIRGALHLWLGVTAARMAVVHGTDPRPVQHWVRVLVTYPLGRLAVFGIGVVFLGFAWNEAQLARRGVMSTHLDPDAARPEAWGVVRWAGRFGMAARAAMFGLVAVAVLGSSVRSAVPTHVDLADILEFLCVSTPGCWLVFVTGVGLAAYGSYLAVLACRRRMPA
jgi:hypothetical protein